MSYPITSEDRSLGQGARGIGPSPHTGQPTSILPKKRIPGVIDSDFNNQTRTSSNKELAFELARLFSRISDVIDLNIPVEEKKSKHYISYQIPIDESFKWIEKPGRELTIRFFKHALRQFNIKLTKYNLLNIYESCDCEWGVKMNDSDLRKTIVGALNSGETTITFSTDELPTLQRCYRRWLDAESKRLRDLAAWVKREREKSAAFIGDFYKAHWNGLVGVVEGLAEVPLLAPNLVGKARGKDWTHANLGAAKFEYTSPWGKKYGGAMETGVGLGLTGPIMLVSKSTLVLGAMGRAGKALNVSPRVVRYIKALILGSEVVGGVQTANEIYTAIKIIQSRKITVDGITRPATPEEINAAIDKIFLLAIGEITASSFARSAHGTVNHLDRSKNNIGELAPHGNDIHEPVPHENTIDQLNIDRAFSEDGEYHSQQTLQSIDRQGRHAEVDHSANSLSEARLPDGRRDHSIQDEGPFVFVSKRQRRNPTEAIPAIDEFGLSPSNIRHAEAFFKRRPNAGFRDALGEAENGINRERMQEIRRLMSEATTTSEESAKALIEKRAKDLGGMEYNNFRGRYWRKVKKHDHLVETLENAGFVVPKGSNEGSKAPYYLRPDGKEEYLTLEHDIRRVDDPGLSVSANNFSWSLGRENSGMLEALRRHYETETAKWDQ